MEQRFFRKHWIFLILSAAILIFSPMALAQDAPAPAPVDPTDSQEFANTVADHYDQLQSLLKSFGPDSVQQLILAGISIYLKILVVAILLQFVEDMLLARLFAALFVPVLANVKRASIWAGAQFGVRLIIFGLIFAALMVWSATHNGFLGFILILVVLLLWAIIGLASTAMIYQIGIGLALGFNIGTFIIEGVAGAIVMIPLQTIVFTTAWEQVVNDHLVVKINAETDNVQNQIKLDQAALDKAKQDNQDLENKVASDQHEQDDINKKLEERVKADDYSFAALAHLRATGKLDEALAGYRDFANKFPGSPYIPDAESAATELEKYIADKTAEDLRIQAEEKKAADAKEAALHADLDAGNATLSEVRARLLGLSRSDVRKFLGEPDDTASDVWGYGKQMILNRQDGLHHGLTVEFFQGVVRSVDYYYGPQREK